MDKRRLLINLLSNFLSALSGVGLSFFLTPYIVDTLGKEAYGFYPLSGNFIMYAGIITTALNSMSGRFITISLERKNIEEVNVYFNSVLVGNFLLSIFFIIVGGGLSYFIDIILDVPLSILTDVRLLFVFVFISLIIGISSSVFSVAAFALNRLDILAFNSIIINAFRLLFTIVLFYFFAPKLYFLGLISIMTAIFYFYLNYRTTKKILPEVHIDFSLFSYSALILLVGSGVWNSVSALSNVINTQLDLLIANKFFGASDMGTLSFTKFVPSGIQMLMGIVVPVFLPEMIRDYANNDLDKLKANLSFSFKAIFLIVLIPLAIFFVYGEPFFKLWLPNENHKLLYYLSIITLIPFVVHGTIETIYHVFVITNKLKIVAYWGIFISLLNFCLVIILCEKSEFGLYSIPLAALITGVLSHLIFTPWYASYCLGERKHFFLLKVLNGLVGFIILVIVAYGWKIINLISSDSWVGLIVNVLILGSILFTCTLFAKFERRTLNSVYFKLKSKFKL